VSSNNRPRRGNDYLAHLGPLYAKTPKAVFAAMAFSFAFIDVEEQGVEQALARLRFEWQALYDNGIVPQKPPKHTSSTTEPIQ
jgi:hypothetical protein